MRARAPQTFLNTYAPILFGNGRPAAITSIGTSSGTEAGGMTVQINGTGFLGVSGASAVQLGGVNAASYTVVSDSRIDAVTPAISNSTVFPSRAVLGDYRDHALSSTAADNAVNVSVTKGGVTSTLASAYTYTSEIARIMGALYGDEYRANDPRIGLNASAISSWPSYSGANALSQATGSKQPAFETAGWNGGPSGLGDGVDDGLKNNALTGYATAKRPFVFIALQRVSGGNYFSALISTTGNNSISLQSTGAAWRCARTDGGASANTDIATGHNTNKHLIYRGFSTGGTNTLVVDSTGGNNARTNATSEAMTQFSLFADQNANAPSNVRIVAAWAFNDEPTAQNITDLIAAIKTTIPWVGYTSLSLGLP